MKWFVSYIQVFTWGTFQFGHLVYADAEHPIAKVSRWNKEYGDEDGKKIVILSFQQVPDNIPDADILSHRIVAEN